MGLFESLHGGVLAWWYEIRRENMDFFTDHVKALCKMQKLLFYVCTETFYLGGEKIRRENMDFFTDHVKTLRKMQKFLFLCLRADFLA